MVAVGPTGFARPQFPFLHCDCGATRCQISFKANQSGYPLGCRLCQAQAVATMSSSLGYFGFHPSSRTALAAEATNFGGSPGRRGFSTAGIFFPVTFSHIWITWRTE